MMADPIRVLDDHKNGTLVAIRLISFINLILWHN